MSTDCDALERLYQTWELDHRRTWPGFQTETAALSAEAVDEYLRTGREVIEVVRRLALRFSLVFGGVEAMDFGCGPGRLTQALADYFRRVTGADLSPTSLRIAKAINRRPECRFVLEPSPRLETWPGSSLDLVLSKAVFQHMPDALMVSYIEGFARVLRPGGLLVFQDHCGVRLPVVGGLPPFLLTGPLAFIRGHFPRLLGERGRRWDVYWRRPATVRATLHRSGFDVRGEVAAEGPEDGRMLSRWYFAVRTHPP